MVGGQLVGDEEGCCGSGRRRRRTDRGCTGLREWGEDNFLEGRGEGPSAEGSKDRGCAGCGNGERLIFGRGEGNLARTGKGKEGQRLTGMEW